MTCFPSSEILIQRAVIFSGVMEKKPVTVFDFYLYNLPAKIVDSPPYLLSLIIL